MSGPAGSSPPHIDSSSGSSVVDRSRSPRASIRLTVHANNDSVHVAAITNTHATIAAAAAATPHNAPNDESSQSHVLHIHDDATPSYTHYHYRPHSHLTRSPASRSVTTIHVRPALSTPSPRPDLHDASDHEEDETMTHLTQSSPTTIPAFPWSSIARSPSVSVSRITSTLRRVPSSASRSFDAIPAGILTLALEYLTSRELCALTRTNRKLAELSSRNSLWAVRCAFMQHADVVQPQIQAEMQKLTNFKHRYLMYRRYRLQNIEDVYSSQVRSLRQRKLMCLIHCLDGPSFFCVLGLFLTLGLILTARHIESDHGESALASWAVWPYYAAIGFVALLTLCVCLARADRHRHRCFHPDTYANPNGVVRSIMIDSFSDHSNQLALMAVMFAAFVLFVLFFLMRVSGVIDWSYFGVFSPLFFDFTLLALMCYFPITLDVDFRLRFRGCLTWWCLIVGPLCAFTLLLAFRLDHVGFISHDGDRQELSWMMVMIPIFIIIFFICLLTVGISYEERDLKPFLLGVCCYGPIIILQVLLSHWLDSGGFAHDSPRFVHVLIPLWMMMSICLFFSMIVCAITRLPTTRMSILNEPKPIREPLIL